VANDTDLTDAATAAAELGISSSEPQLARFVRVASSLCRDYLNRDQIHYQTGIVENVAGFAFPRLILKVYPVLSVASVVMDGGTLDPSEYVLDEGQSGIIYRRYGWPSTGMYRPGIVQRDIYPGMEQKQITVTYAGGYVTPGQVAKRRRVAQDAS
jgi:hypothetical protein